jgi:hypothetical protein
VRVPNLAFEYEPDVCSRGSLSLVHIVDPASQSMLACLRSFLHVLCCSLACWPFVSQDHNTLFANMRHEKNPDFASQELGLVALQAAEILLRSAVLVEGAHAAEIATRLHYIGKELQGQQLYQIPPYVQDLSAQVLRDLTRICKVLHDRVHTAYHQLRRSVSGASQNDLSALRHLHRHRGNCANIS